MGYYNVPKNRKRGDKGRIVIDNPIMSLALYIVVFCVGIALAGLIALSFILYRCRLSKI
jgi:hypothetical protein